MDKWTSPVAAKLSKVQNALENWFRNNEGKWRSAVDKDIETLSKGKWRVFQTFFESPEEAFSGNFEIQVLDEYDIQQMYPQFLSNLKDIPKNSYSYIFTCNNGIQTPLGNKAFICQTFLSF